MPNNFGDLKVGVNYIYMIMKFVDSNNKDNYNVMLIRISFLNL